MTPVRTLLFLLLAGVATAAPAPVPKPAPPIEVVGVWTMDWNTCASRVLLDRGGSFGDTYCGEDWLGTWRLEGDVLTVTETAPDGRTLTWRARLTPPPRGKRGCGGRLLNGGHFALRE